MYGSPPKTANMAAQGGLFGMQQWHEDNLESSKKGSQTTKGKDSEFGKQLNQYHLPHGYGFLPSEQ